MESICIFCGSSIGDQSIYSNLTEKLGKDIAKRDLTLIYGGGNVGLMGKIADAVLDAGGRAIGVIPQFLVDREVAHPNLTELVIVNSMHERKLKMSELADSFVALPGGLGTLEELAEIITWSQLELIKKPIGILNVDGYYDQLMDLFDQMVSRGFLNKQFRETIIAEEQPEVLLDKIVSSATPTEDGDLGKT